LEGWQRGGWGTGFREERLPLSLVGMAGRVVWLRACFSLDKEPSPLRPLGVVVKASGLRMLVFVNGELVGRLGEDSPGRLLYVPEPALRQGLNEMVIAGLVTSGQAVVESVELVEYYSHKKALIELELE
jgi:hypothetical protein